MRDLDQRDFSPATFFSKPISSYLKPILQESTLTGACFHLRRIAGKKAGWNCVSI
jgi:hypothetical protein